nr:MAG TPA: tail protein [Caudoviricetes sp.]
MLTFYNEKGEGFGAQVEFTVKNAVNGERSVSGTIISNDRVLSGIDKGWKFELNGEFFTIVYAKPQDQGRNLSVSFDAVHQFFYDFDHSNCYTEFNGSHRFEVYIEAIFKDSGYRYQIEPSVRVNSIRKENFGNAKRLEMFKDIIKAAGLEFSVSGKVVLITKKIGSDLSTIVRKNFNMNELVIEKNINKFITYKKGFGAWKDEENHSKGRYTSEYESPLARIYGRIEGEPVTDERYKDTGKLLERLKFEVDNSYSISVQLDMEDLTRAGYQYTQPRAGDYIMAINETTRFREKIRIVSFESSYDVTGRLINHKVTCNDIGSVQKQISSESSIIRSAGQSKEYAESALAVATKALASADGKNTVYYGATKPKDEPIGTIRRGDILYLTAGEETEMYIWNGSEWELRKLKFDTAEFEKEINKQFESLYLADINEARNKANQALRTAGANAGLANEAKRISERISGDMNTFKSDYRADLNGINLRIAQTTANNIQMFSSFTNDINGRMAQMASQVEGKVNQADFQSVKETAQLYERVLGGSENDVSRNVSRLVMSDQIFQTEVGKYVTDDNNLIVNSETMDKNVLVNERRQGVNVSVNNGIFTIKAQGLTSENWSGFTLPIYVRKIYKGETYSVGFKYRVRGALDDDFNVIIKNHVINRAAFTATAGRPSSPVSDEWKEFQGTFYMSSDFEFGNHKYLPFYAYITKNGWIEIKEVMLVRGSKTGPYKPSQFDDAYKMNEATRTQMTLLSNSWSVKTLNGPGDVLGAINLNPDGSVKINEGLISVGEKTYIKDGVIKKSMIGKAQIGTAHIGEIDASKANIINISAKNIIADGLTANIIRGGKLSSLNGKSDFDLQTGWLEMNQEAVGIRNRFPGKPLQFLIFGQGSLNGVPGAYTQLMSNRNGATGIEHTSAGIQIWNGRLGDNIQTAITFYGKTMDFMPNSLGGGITVNTENRTISNLDNIYFRGTSLVTILDLINKNFEGIATHFEYNRLGAPGRYKVSV